MIKQKQSKSKQKTLKWRDGSDIDPADVFGYGGVIKKFLDACEDGMVYKTKELAEVLGHGYLRKLRHPTEDVRLNGYWIKSRYEILYANKRTIRFIKDDYAQ